MRDNRLDVANVMALAEEELESEESDEKEKDLDMIRDITSDCADVTDNDRCEAAIKIYECFHISAKVHGFDADF